MNGRIASGGFTLVELLVTIAIVAILASLMLSGVRTVRESSRQMSCASNLRQLHLGHSLYAEDWEGWIMPGYWGAGAGYEQWFPYHIQIALGTDAPAWNRYDRVVLCPGQHLAISPWLGSFKMNYWVSAKCSHASYIAASPTYTKRPFTGFPAASQTLFLYDSGDASNNGCGHSEQTAAVTFRHPGGANALFADGHVTAIRENTISPSMTGIWRGQP